MREEAIKIIASMNPEQVIRACSALTELLRDAERQPVSQEESNPK